MPSRRPTSSFEQPSAKLDHLTLTIRDDRRPLMKQFDHAGEATNGPAR
jgi:hypothetical protein